MWWKGSQGRKKEVTLKRMQGKKWQESPFFQYIAKYIGLMLDLVHQTSIHSEIKALKDKDRNTRMIKDNQSFLRIAYLLTFKCQNYFMTATMAVKCKCTEFSIHLSCSNLISSFSIFTSIDEGPIFCL